jgi:GT2 family glycosyltransferase
MYRDPDAVVGVVILNYDSAKDTLAAIDSLLASAYLNLRIVVVDNDSNELDRKALRDRLPTTVEYLAPGRNLGYAAGNNLGIAHLLDQDVDYVLILNPDARVGPDTVAGLIAASERVPDAGMIGPRLLHGNSESIQSDGCVIDWGRAGATSHINAGGSARPTSAETAVVDYVTGACVLAPRRLFEDAGLLPEDYFLYFEETHFAVTARRRGWLSVVDRSVIARHHRRSTGAVPSRAYLYYLTRNRGIFAARFVPGERAVDEAYADLQQGFLKNWRARVATAEPRLLTLFDEVVDLAQRHGRSGVTGACEQLDRYSIDGVPGWA